MLRTQVLYLESMDGADLVPVTTGSSLDPKSQLVFNRRRVGCVEGDHRPPYYNDLFVSLSFNGLPMIASDNPSPLGVSL